MEFLIGIDKLSVDAHIGCHEAERARPQPLWITLQAVIKTPLQDVHVNLSNTLDYFSVSQQIIKEVQKKERILIETLAQDLLKLFTTEQFLFLKKITLRIEKPFALASNGVPFLEVSKVFE